MTAWPILSNSRCIRRQMDLLPSLACRCSILRDSRAKERPFHNHEAVALHNADLILHALLLSARLCCQVPWVMIPWNPRCQGRATLEQSTAIVITNEFLGSQATKELLKIDCPSFFLASYTSRLDEYCDCRRVDGNPPVKGTRLARDRRRTLDGTPARADIQREKTQDISAVPRFTPPLN